MPIRMCLGVWPGVLQANKNVCAQMGPALHAASGTTQNCLAAATGAAPFILNLGLAHADGGCSARGCGECVAAGRQPEAACGSAAHGQAAPWIWL